MFDFNVMRSLGICRRLASYSQRAGAMPRIIRFYLFLCFFLCLTGLVQAQGIVSLVGSSTAGSGGGTASSLTLDKPVGVIPGDVLVASISIRSTSAINAPAGWITIENTSATNRMHTMYRVVDGSEGTTFSFSGWTATQSTGILLAYRNVDEAALPPAEAAAGSGSSSTLTVNAVTVPKPNAKLVVFYNSRATTITPNAALTTITSVATTGTLITNLAADEDLTASGSTGNRNGTSNSSQRFITHAIALPAIETAGTIEFVGKTTNAVASTASLSLAIPAGTQEGDFLIAAVNRVASGTISAPSGWTLATNENADVSMAVFWKFAGPSEGSAAFTAASANMSGVLLAYRNVNRKQPYTAYNDVSNAGASATVNSVNTGVAETRLLAFFSGRHGAAFNFLNYNGMMAIDSAKVTTGTHVGILALTSFINAAGATGSRTNSITNTSTPRTAAALFVLRPAKTFFSYQNGNWNSAISWTKDPSGTTLLPLTGEVPTPYDSVVILNGKTITLSANVTTDSIGIRMVNGGFLDLQTNTLPTLTGLTGQGTIRSSRTTGGSTYMPTVLYGNNVMASPNGGTFEYYCAANMTLNTAVSNYANLILRREGSGETVYSLASNVTVSNNLTLNRTGSAISNLTFGNDGTPRSLTVGNNLTVEAGCRIRPQDVAGFLAHTLLIGGDLVNNGSIRFTNQAARDYENAANNRVVEVTFTGATDNKMDCFGQTDFYRLIIDKGIDQTYVLTVNSSDTTHFRLFAPNNQANTGLDAAPNPVVNKALYIKNGTLRLRNNIFIPYLTTGGNDFFVVQNACLWVDGATVFTAQEGSGNRGLTVIGRLRLSAGEINTAGTAGFVYRVDGVFQIEGGVARVVQFRRSGTGSGFRAAYIQTGGLLEISGNGETNTGFAAFSLPDADCSFTMSGGEIRIRRAVSAAAERGFHVAISTLNGNVTGGLVNIITDDNTAFNISSTVPLHNVEISRSAGAASVLLNTALTVRNNLTLSSGANFSANSNNLTVGGNLTVNTGTTLTNGTNVLGFNGTAKQTFRVDGTLSGIHQLNISKASDTLELAGSLATFTVASDYTLAAGARLNTNGKTLDLQAGVTHSGVHTGAGKILLSTATSRIINGTGNGVFNNLELGGGAATTYTTTAAFRITGNLNFVGANNRILDIGGNSLVLDSNATITGASAASPLRMIRLNGNQSALGVTKRFNSLSFTFPVGTTTEYAPATISFDVAPSTYGSITVRPVSNEHPNVTNAGRSLTYYWRVVASDFVLGTAKVTQNFTYPAGRLVTGSGITADGYVNARFSQSNASWTAGLATAVDETNRIITFAGSGFETTITGDYTAGDNAPVDPFGTVTIYYSYKTGARWDSVGTWSTTGHTGLQAMPATPPSSNSVVRVGNGNTVLVLANGAVAGSLSIDSLATLDVGSTTGHNFGALVGEGVSGKGTLRVSSSSGTATFPGGDFNTFFGTDGGKVVYYRSAVNFTLPTITSQYNNLAFEINTGSSTDFIDLPALNLTVLGNMEVHGSAAGRVRFNPGASGDLTVNGNLSITGSGLRMRYAGSADRLLEVLGNVTIASGAAIDNANEANRVHTLRISGNLTNNGTLNLFATTARHTQLEFVGQRSANFTGTNAGASASVYLMTINKGITGKDSLLQFDQAGTTTFNGTSGWLSLQKGTFRIARAVTINLSSAAEAFSIPEDASLCINHASAVVNIGNSASDTADLLLRGRLEILNGTVNIGDVANNNNNDIELASAGLPEIVISGGNLNVNGSIRRGLVNQAGALFYKQTGGTVNIRGRAAYGQRGKLEVVNTGSYFEMTGSTSVINILRGGASSVADFYVRPDANLVNNGTLNFAPGSAIGNQSYTLDATVPIYDVAVTGVNGSNTATVSLLVNNFSILNDFTINDFSTFTCNDLNINVGADFTRIGNFQAGTNTVTFTGNAASTTGTFTGSNAFHNLRLANNVTLTQGAAIRVNNNLTINSGATFANGNFPLEVLRDVSNSGTHTNPSNSGVNALILMGTVNQLLSGNGTYGNVVVNNANNIEILGNATINNQLTISAGLVDIGDRTLTLGLNAVVSGTFSTARMIRTNGVLSDGGVTKLYPASALDFTFPIGILNKYSPARINLTANSATGTVNVKPVNVKHPSTRVANETQLNYFWEVSTTGLSGVTAALTFNYTDAEVTTNESNWRGGRFVFPNWTPINGITGVVNAAANQLVFNLTGTINGSFTAGNSNEFAGVPTLYSRSAVCSTGCDWNNVNSWSETNHDGPPTSSLPNGQPMVIAGTDSVFMAVNNLTSESVRLEPGSVLDTRETFGHNLGVVNGQGKIKVRATSNNLFVYPGGNYTAFASDTGGTVEFYGSTNGTLPATQLAYHKLLFTDGSTRTQANVDWVITGEMRLRSGVVTNTLFNRNWEVRNNWINEVGNNGFVPGSGKVTFNSASAQSLTGATIFYDLEIAGGGAKNLNNDITVRNQLLLQNGRVYTNSSNLIMDSTAITAGSPSTAAMVVQNGSGRVVKNYRSASGTFTYPIGEETGTAEYSPITLTFTEATFSNSAQVSVQVTDAQSAECSGGNNFLSRFWTFSQSGVTSFLASVTARYTAADVNGTEASIVARMSRPSLPCLNGNNANVSAKTISINGIAVLNILSGGEGTLPEPTVSATLVTFTNVGATSMTIKWTNGNGSGRLVLMRSGAAVSSNPVDFTSYTADSVFAAGSQIGTGNWVVFLSNRDSVTVTGLTAGTIYHVAVFEYSNFGIDIDFRLTSPALGNRSTLALEPTTAAASISFSSFGVSGFTVNWTNGNGARRLVLAKASSAVDAQPTDGVGYTANTTFGSGDELGSGNFVVYEGTGNSFAVSGLNQNTRYHFSVYEYNGTGGGANYRQAGAPVGNRHTWLRIQAKAWLEGPYDTASSQMARNLSAVLPKAHPYKNAPWNFSTYDSIQSLPGGNLVDWVLIEIRVAGTAAAANASSIRGRVLGFINDAGDLVDTAGNTNGIVVPTDSNGQFYVAIYHRTHVPVMSASNPSAPVDQVTGAYQYNFTTGVGQAYGTAALVSLKAGVWGLYAGRIENTTPFTIDAADRDTAWTDRNRLGYEPADAALEGAVDATTRSITWNNRTRASQIP